MGQSRYAQVPKLQPETSRWLLNHANIGRIADKDLERDLAYLRGERRITLPQLEDLSRRLHLPMSYFLASTPPDEDFPILKCRTHGSTDVEAASRELVDTIAQMEDIQGWIQDQRLDVGIEPLAFVGAVHSDTSVEAAAAKVRSLLQLQLDWFSRYSSIRTAFDELRERMGNLGATTILGKHVGRSTNRTLALEEFRAFAMCDRYAPLIFINANDTEGGQLFSLLHEFVHLCLGTSDLDDGSRVGEYHVPVRPEEQICNAVAGELLVPTQGFIEQWTMLNDVDDLYTVCERLSRKPYTCSTVVVARRALELDLISQDEYRAVENEAIRHAREAAQAKKAKLKEDKPAINANAIIKRNLSSRFIQMVAAGVANGTTTYTEAFRLTGTTNKSFFNLVKLAGRVAL